MAVARYPAWITIARILALIALILVILVAVVPGTPDFLMAIAVGLLALALLVG